MKEITLKKLTAILRQDNEPPPVIARLGWRYHHVGIPTLTPHAGERYLPQYKMYVAGFERNPFGVEWMRFEEDCPLPALIQNVAHVAFEVDDLDAALEGLEVIFPPGEPSEGVRAATFVQDGAPIELITFCKK